MIKVKKLFDDTKLPLKAKNGDAGFDVFSREKITIWPAQRYCFSLGFAIEIPSGYVALIQAKSGMALKNGITTIGNVIDSGYRGECHAILLNTSENILKIEIGQKIAQLLIMPCYTEMEISEVIELQNSARDINGFGSTGKF